MAAYNEEIEAASASIQGAAALAGSAGDAAGAAKSDLEKGRGDFEGKAVVLVQDLGRALVQLLTQTSEGAQTCALQAKGILGQGQALLDPNRSNPEAELVPLFQAEDAKLDEVIVAIANLLGNTAEINGAFERLTTALNNKAGEFGYAADKAAEAQGQAYTLRETASNMKVPQRS